MEMRERIYRVPQPILPPDYRPKGPDRGSKTPAGEDFARVLERVQGEIKFSRHALERLQTRNITLTAGEVGRLQDAVERAASKGARDSLILMDELAFVVSFKNRTVITAMDGESMKEHVFTNIDSAVIVK
jgi:flagellar operon protein